MQALGEKFIMSDEETDIEDKQSFVKRSLKWRSEKLNDLLKKLDDRYARSREKKDNVRPMKTRKVGNPSDRSPPANAPIWALAATGSTNINAPDGSESSDSSRPNSDIEDDPEMNDWLSNVTGVNV